MLKQITPVRVGHRLSSSFPAPSCSCVTVTPASAHEGHSADGLSLGMKIPKGWLQVHEVSLEYSKSKKQSNQGILHWQDGGRGTERSHVSQIHWSLPESPACIHTLGVTLLSRVQATVPQYTLPLLHCKAACIFYHGDLCSRTCIQIITGFWDGCSSGQCKWEAFVTQRLKIIGSLDGWKVHLQVLQWRLFPVTAPSQLPLLCLLVAS